MRKSVDGSGPGQGISVVYEIIDKYCISPCWQDDNTERRTKGIPEGQSKGRHLLTNHKRLRLLSDGEDGGEDEMVF